MTQVCAADQASSTRPRIGLVLGGGGARGAAHVGVLKVLEELRIPIDYIAGTSMGAIVGALYASGMSPDQIAHELETINWDEIFDDRPPRGDQPWIRKRDDDTYLVKYQAGYGDGKIKFPLGVVQGQKFDIELARLLQPVVGIDDFDELTIPFRAVATDIGTGEAVILDRGSLARSVRASMAVPGAFGAVEIDDRLLVDGMVANNVPVDVARALGADIVIVVDVGEPLKSREEISSLFGVIGQIATLMSRRNVEAQLATLKPADVLIQPALGDFSASDFNHAAEAITIGFQAADEARAELAGLSVAEGDYSAYTAALARPATSQVPVIEFLRIANRSSLGEEVIEKKLGVEIGQPFDRERLERGVAELYGLELFSSVRYQIVKEGSRTGVKVELDERHWGPDYLKFGLALSSDLQGDSLWDLGAQYRKTALNAYAGEVVASAQVGENPLAAITFYQPLDPALRWFVHPTVVYDSRNFSRFEGDEEAEEFRVHRYGGSLDGGRNLGQWGEARVGLRRYAGDIHQRIGSPDVPDRDFDSAEAFLRLSYDTLDDRNFPTSGALATTEWLESIESLGADTDFSQLDARAGLAHTWSQLTAFGGAQVLYTAAGTPPVQSRVRTGGFTRLSGFTQDELSGQQLVLLRSGFYQRIYERDWLTLYWGASMEYGNVYEDRNDISLEPEDALLAGSLFLGADLPLGPLYLGYGHAESGHDSIYVYLGRIF